MRSPCRLITVPRHEVVNSRNIWNIIKTIVEFRDGLANTYTVRHFGHEHDKPISQLWLQTWRFVDQAASSHLTPMITQSNGHQTER
jgi:hypothetical protein